MPDLPMPLRAALGLVAIAMDEARRLPDRAIELPMLAVGTVLQVSMHAQQRYAELAARGDELISGHRVGDEPPEWARFDDSADGLASDEGSGERDTGTGDTGMGETGTGGIGVGSTGAAAGTAAEAAATGGEQGAGWTTPKSVPTPRHTEPSRFDTVDDD